MIFWLLDEHMPDWDVDQPAFLNPVELLKLPGKRFAKRRVEWLHGRLAAKTLLQARHPDCQGLPLTEILIANAAGGAPFASAASGTRLSGCISISHSGLLAACALTLDPQRQVGIDLERVELRQADLFESYFTPRENAYVRRSPPEALQSVTTLIWSAKEAVLKALGIGLSLDTRQIEIEIINEGMPEAVQTPADTDSAWRRFEVGVTASGQPWQWEGWWQTYRDYILTLAVASQGNVSDQGLGGEIPLQVG